MSIATERAALDRIPGGPDLRRREKWGARRSYADARAVSACRYQFVHISITNPRNYASADAHARALEAIGIARFPNTGVSYNRGVTPDGTAFELQPMDRRGAHTVNDKGLARCASSGCPSRGGSLSSAAGNLNYDVRAYVIMQNVGDPVSDRQLDVLAQVMAKDRLAGLVPLNAPIHGHRCVAWKSCPGDRMWALIGRLKQLVDHYVRAGLGATNPDPEEDDMANLFESIDEFRTELRNAQAWVSEKSEQWARNVRRIVWSEQKIYGRPEAPEGVSALQELADAKTLGLKNDAALQAVTAKLAALPGLEDIKDVVSAATAKVTAIDVAKQLEVTVKDSE